MRTFPVWLFVLGVFMASCSTESSSQADRPATPPNIIFIMTDDHAFQAISAYGSGRNQTPNIDRIADMGMRFDQAFVTNSICAPSRAVILTGMHSHLNSVRDNIESFDSTILTYPQLLQQAGYETAMIGKWHLKTLPVGFNYWKVLPGQGHYYNPDWRTANGVVRDTGYVTDIITNEALSWLEEDRDRTKPFLLVYQHKAPHRDWRPGPEQLDDWIGRDLPAPPTLADDYQGRGRAAREQELSILADMTYTHDMKIPPTVLAELGITEEGWHPRAYQNSMDRMTPEQREAWNQTYQARIDDFRSRWPMTDEELRNWKYQAYMEDYLACIESVDDNIGRLLDYLEANDLMDNTIIVYTSDQGFYLGEHGWFDKRFMYEESFRTPLIVAWPGVTPAGTVNEELVQNLDFAPTFLAAAGVEIPAQMQGKSLLPLLQQADDPWRDAIYYHYYEYPGVHAVKRHYGVRTDRYKLMHFYYDIDEWEMYDLEQDPLELQNVYEDPNYVDIREQLHRRLDELQVQYGDTTSWREDNWSTRE